MSIEVGASAPGFTLVDQHRASFTLSEHRGSRAVLMVFFPFAFSGVCTGELSGLRDRLGDFETDDATLVALSCDPVFTLRAFADRDGLFFPLLSDYWPHGAVSSAYSVFDAAHGCPTRSSVLVDRDGVVRWTVDNDPGEARDLDQHAEAVAALSPRRVV